MSHKIVTLDLIPISVILENELFFMAIVWMFL